MVKTKKKSEGYYPKTPKVNFKVLVNGENFAVVVVSDCVYYVNQEGYKQM